ncbi:fluoride efflux transporter FluC [Polycladospora coralii]|uniref:fluoride efflux transporter FluC n=1 Tax=Polycladospora coralii TaxID=2771432 RepID=UPI00321FDB90
MRIHLYVFLGGVIGTSLRLFLTLWLDQSIFPTGTFFVNLCGSFALGFLFAYAKQKRNVPDEIKVGLGTGLIGSFTTFSAFTAQLVNLQLPLAFLYASTSICLGLLCAYVGGRLAYTRT